MPRKSFAIRHLKARPPSEQTARQYLLHWHSADLYHNTQTFPPVSSGAMFGDNRPLHLEVGCGTGEFLCYLAAASPGTNFIGVDMSLKSLYIAVEKARSANLHNVRFIRAAIQYVYPLVVSGSLEKVYLHFPDPCLHPKFRKKRVFGPLFLDNVYRMLSPTGELSVMTDEPQLFSIMLAQIEADPRYEKLHNERYLAGAGWDAPSRYQVAWERRGRQPMRFLVSKAAVPEAEQATAGQM